MVYVGAHRSIAGGVLNTIKNTVEELKGNAIQIFNGSNRSAKLSSKTKLTPEQMKEIKKYVSDNDIYFVIHSIYLLNLCRKGTTIKFMLDNLVKDIETANDIGAEAVVLHTGYQLNLDSEEAYQNMHDNVVDVIERTNNVLILLETPAGQGSQIATSLEDFAKLYNMFSSKHKKRLGICIDTAHIFAGGVDVSSDKLFKQYLRDFNRLIGTKVIKLFHINDSQKPLNSHRDLHENIGQGYIFEKKISLSLKYLAKFASKHNIPLILETKGDRYKEEIDLLKHLALDK